MHIIISCDKAGHLFDLFFILLKKEKLLTNTKRDKIKLSTPKNCKHRQILFDIIVMSNTGFVKFKNEESKYLFKRIEITKRIVFII